MANVKVKAVYRTALNKSLMAATTQLDAGKFVEFGRRTIVAQEGLSLGYGNLAGQDSAIGRIYADMKKAGGVAVDGVVRIEIRNAQDRPQRIIFEGRTEQLRTLIATPSVNLMMPFPEMQEMVTEDNSFVFLMNGDTSDIITKADSSIIMDATSYDLG